MNNISLTQKKLGVIKKMFFAVIVFLIFFGSLEGIQRIRHPHVGFRGMTNSKGFRSLEFSTEKKAGVFRILFIGSSTTFSITGPVEKTFPYLTGELLKEKIPGMRIETINASWPAKTSYWEVKRLKETLSLDPDLVIIMTGYNDAASIFARFAKIGERGDLVMTSWPVKLETFLAQYSVLYVTLKEKISIWVHGRPDFAFGKARLDLANENMKNGQWLENYPKHFRANVEKMLQLLRSRQIPAVFMEGPLSDNRRNRVPLYAKAYLRLTEELEQFCQEQNIPLLDLSLFFPSNEQGILISQDGLHFNAEGNLRIAEALSSFLIDHNQVKKNSPAV